MGDAYECDRCGDLHRGTAFAVVDEYDIENYPSRGDHSQELCKECAEELHEFWHGDAPKVDE